MRQPLAPFQQLILNSKYMSSEGLLQLERLEGSLRKDIDEARGLIEIAGKELHSRADKIDARIEKLEAKVDKNDEKAMEKISARVSYKQFYIIIGFLVSLFIGMAGLLFVEVKELREVATDTRQSQIVDATNITNMKENLSDIKTILGNAEISK